VSYQLTSAILGFALASIILWLIRRDLLHSRHASWWLLTAFMIIILGTFPKITDFIAIKLGVNYPPTLVFILGMGMLLIKVINIDIQQSQLERKIRRLTQKLAILEGEHYAKQDEHDP
jgi:hypothetical protein